MKYKDYNNAFEEILNNLLNETYKYNSVSSLKNYIDSFNLALNGNIEFYNQQIFKDIEIDFNGIYSKKEEEKRKELEKKISSLKPLESLNESFEEFINKQEKFKFEFEIENEDLTHYGSFKEFDDYYEMLKKKKSFKVDPKEIFLKSYNTEKLRLGIKKNEKNKNKIFDLFIKKQNEISNYFALLKFKQKIDLNMNLKLNISTELRDYKLEREKELKEYFNNKIKEKNKEWEAQIERAKWKTPVQTYGNLTCKNGHQLTGEVICSKCKENLYWVDADERYVICKGCNEVRQLSEKRKCECGAESYSTLKWIKGYKP
jgi:hypothetical protein